MAVDSPVELLIELLTHDEKGYGPWTPGMKNRVRDTIKENLKVQLPLRTRRMVCTRCWPSDKVMVPGIGERMTTASLEGGVLYYTLHKPDCRRVAPQEVSLDG